MRSRKCGGGQEAGEREKEARELWVRHQWGACGICAIYSREGVGPGLVTRSWARFSS